MKNIKPICVTTWMEWSQCMGPTDEKPIVNSERPGPNPTFSHSERKQIRTKGNTIARSKIKKSMLNLIAFHHFFFMYFYQIRF